MAKDPRRFVSFTLSEEQSSWIETKFGGPEASKADAIKSIITEAMSEKPKPSPAGNEAQEPVVSCGMNGANATLNVVLATIEMLTQKYMADHPERSHSRDFEATMVARWIKFYGERKAHMTKETNVAP